MAVRPSVYLPNGPPVYRGPIFNTVSFDKTPPSGEWTKDPLILEFRLALEALVGAASKEALEETKKYLETISMSRSVKAELDAVNLLLKTLE